MSTLQLSQKLLIEGIISISFDETEDYFTTCDEFGESDWLPFSSRWLPLTDKAQEIWKGEVSHKNGLTLGKVYTVKEV